MQPNIWWLFQQSGTSDFQVSSDSPKSVEQALIIANASILLIIFFY